MGLGLTSTRLVRGANERIRTEIPFNSYMTISITMHTSSSRARRGRKWPRTIHRKDGDRAIDLHEALQESIEAGSARIAPTNFVDILHFFSPPIPSILVGLSVIQLFYPPIRGSSVQPSRNERKMNEREKRAYYAQAARKHRAKVRMEAELLKKENERLKRENDALRRENESYKRELLSLQGTLLGWGVSKVQNAEGNAPTLLRDAYRQFDGHHGSPEIPELGAPGPYLMSKESGTLDDAPIPDIVSDNLLDGDLVIERFSYYE